jgi:cytochrome c oxidase assembly protein subunit 15
MSINRRLLTIFAVIATLGTYVIILLGELVTFTGSGHGCGQTWPFCQGEIIPGSLTIAGVIEYTHRIQAGADTALVFILVLWSWLTYRKDFRIKLFSVMSVLSIIAQAALGAVTVVYEGTWEFPGLLAAHFGLSLICFASVLLLSIRVFQQDRTEESGLKKPLGVIPRLQWPVWLLAIYTYVVMYTGALVTHTGAVTGCGQQIFTCTTYIPGFSSLAGIQMVHRYATGLLWLAVMGFLVLAVTRYRERRDIFWGAIWTALLINLQAASGMLNVLTEGQMIPVFIHATLIAVFFAMLCYLCTEAGFPGRKTRVGERKNETEREHAADLPPLVSGRARQA